MLWQWRGLIATMVGRDLLARYKGSSLGVLWSLLHPLVLAMVYTFAFKFVIRIQIPNYALFLLAGLLPWLFFATSLQVAAGSIVDQGQLVKKVAFPREVLPVSAVMSQLVHFTLGYLVVLPVYASSQGRLASVYLALPIVMALQVIFVLGAAVTIAVMQVYLRDTRHLLEVGLQILFWATPVVYSLELVGRYRALLFVNPLTSFVTTYQQIVVDQSMPDPARMATLALLAVVSFAVGYTIFLRAQLRIAEYV